MLECMNSVENILNCIPSRHSVLALEDKELKDPGDNHLFPALALDTATAILEVRVELERARLHIPSSYHRTLLRLVFYDAVAHSDLDTSLSHPIPLLRYYHDYGEPTFHAALTLEESIWPRPFVQRR